MQHLLRLLGSVRELRRYYWSISILSVLVSLMSIVTPLLTGAAVDEVGRGSDARANYVIAFVVGLFLLDLLSNVLNNINGYLGDQMSARLQRALSQRYFEHLLKLPQAYFDKELSGKIINRLSRSISQITNFVQMFSNNFFGMLIMSVFVLIAVAFISWPVALLLLLVYPIYTYMTVKTSSVWMGYQKDRNLHNDIASGRFAEAISQLKVVKSYIRERQELRFFSKHMDKVVDINRPQSRYWHIRDFQRRLVLNVIFFAVYACIFYFAIKGNVSPGQAVALVLLSQQLRMPLFSISFMVENTQRAVADSKDYFEVMSLEPAIADKSEAKTLQAGQGSIEFKAVHFGYEDGKEVLKGLDFTVEPDSKVALVGESGEGKTTITSLLLRLYEAGAGQILVDGHDISQVTQSSLRQNIAVVFQEPALFSGTIRENISYGKPKASSKDIEAAAKAANAHEFIAKLEKGYDTEIGERGLKLSGGQKQRIAIARALLKDAPILILDEATSSLDSRSERAVQEALEHLMKGRTTLIIAHRLSTIQAVDQIITLRNGRVDEIGTPAVLAASGGIYAQLLELQQSTSEATKKRLQRFEIAG